MCKSVLILGCGTMQLPAFRIARQLGWYTAAADANPEAPGRKHCNAFFNIDLKDTNGLIAAARAIQSEHGLDGVLTTGTDFSLSVAMVAEALGLPGHSVEAARRATDKILMRRTFQKAGVPSPPFLEIPSDTVPNITDVIPGPWVVKPVDNMGARGVMRVDSPEWISQAVEIARANSQSGRVLVETYMEGPEFSLDALVEDGRLIRCGMADRIIAYPPYFIEIGHTIPASVDTKTAEKIWTVFEQGVQSLGLTRGAAKGDVKLTPHGPMIGEIAARLSGGFMSGWTWPAASGVEPTRGALRLATGLDAGDMTPQWSMFCAERALIGIDGTAHILNGVERAASIAGVQEVFFLHGPGHAVVFPRNNVEKVANVIAVGNTANQADSRAKAALRELDLILKPYDEATGKYLDAMDVFPPDVFESENFFDAYWSRFPPKPSHGTPHQIPTVRVPLDLPQSLDSTGRTMHAILDVLCAEGRIKKVSVENQFIHNQEEANFWRAIVRGGYMGVRWYLDSFV